MEFACEADYDKIAQGDSLEIKNLIATVKTGKDFLLVNKTNGAEIVCKCDLSDRQKEIILAGGLLSYTKMKG